MSTYVAVGSVCWDVVEGTDDRRLGGSVLFACRVALAHGWDARIITSGTPELQAAVQAALPGVTVHVEPSPEDTVFEFSRQADLGPQRLAGRATPIDLAAHRFDDADVLHLAPIMDEIVHASFGAAAAAPFVGITPQGFLRASDETGRLIRHEQLDAWWVDAVQAAVLSEDEHTRLGEPRVLDAIRTAVTYGPGGCVGLWEGRQVPVPGIDLGEVAPVGTIGAGDVFAAAFFLALAGGGSFEDALVSANEVAAGHVGRGDFASVPDHPVAAVDAEMPRQI